MCREVLNAMKKRVAAGWGDCGQSFMQSQDQSLNCFSQVHRANVCSHLRDYWQQLKIHAEKETIVSTQKTSEQHKKHRYLFSYFMQKSSVVLHDLAAKEMVSNLSSGVRNSSFSGLRWNTPAGTTGASAL